MRTVDEWSEIAEDAFDDFKEARRVFTNAKADYEHKRLTFKARNAVEAKSQAALDSKAEEFARDEKVALIRAEGSLDVAETYLKLAQNEMVAAMSVQKHQGKQDGGW